MPTLLTALTDSCSLKIPETALSTEAVFEMSTAMRPISQVEGLYWFIKSCTSAAGSNHERAGIFTVYVLCTKPVKCRGLISLQNTAIQYQKRNPWFISHDELRKSGAIQNGKFVVSCDIEFNLPWSKLDNIPPIHCLLLKTCPQVKLIVGEDTVEMNKAILTSISPVFNAMFSHDTKEARTGSVRIPDFDFNTVQNVRRFCLGVEFDFTTKECIDMLKFADKYDIKGLQDYLEVCLINNLTADNFCAVADYAWTHSRDTVKINCAQYFSNYGEGVFLTSAFAGLEPTIMASLVKAAVEFTSK